MVTSVAGSPGLSFTEARAVERGIRFAVYLTGGLVTLAIGLEILASSMGEVLNCLYKTDICSNGFSQSIYLETVPILVAGAILVATAIVLVFLAHRSR
ncbi:MAG TPA: hypothetical protein VEH57_09700 [Thermoplasmata archaeon]|nr:hypothetical protein [Thermoplasmata archaeon]